MKRKRISLNIQLNLHLSVLFLCGGNRSFITSTHNRNTYILMPKGKLSTMSETNTNARMTELQTIWRAETVCFDLVSVILSTCSPCNQYKIQNKKNLIFRSIPLSDIGEKAIIFNVVLFDRFKSFFIAWNSYVFSFLPIMIQKYLYESKLINLQRKETCINKMIDSFQSNCTI